MLHEVTSHNDVILNEGKVKVKVKFTLEQAKKAHRGVKV